MANFLSALQRMRARALDDARAFFDKYEAALLEEKYLAADSYLRQHHIAEGRARAFDSAITLLTL